MPPESCLFTAPCLLRGRRSASSLLVYFVVGDQLRRSLFTSWSEISVTAPCSLRGRRSASPLLVHLWSEISLTAPCSLRGRRSASPQKPPGSRLRFSRTRVQHSPGSSTIELPSVSPNLVLTRPIAPCHGTLARAVAPCQIFRDSATSSRRAPNWRSEEAHRVGTILNQPNWRCVSTDRLSRVDSQVVSLLRVSPALHPPKRPSHTHNPKRGFGGRGKETWMDLWSSHVALCGSIARETDFWFRETASTVSSSVSLLHSSFTLRPKNLVSSVAEFRKMLLVQYV